MNQHQIDKMVADHLLWLQNDPNGIRFDSINQDLRGLNLAEKNLTKACFPATNVSNFCFHGFSLDNASFQISKLIGADFRDAILTFVDFRDADLTNANLQGADLTGANFGMSDTHSAILKNTKMPDISWLKSGCLVKINEIRYGFWLEVDGVEPDDQEHVDFSSNSVGIYLKNHSKNDKTFDLLTDNKLIRGIPSWVKYTGLSQS